jgi:hypothetical protein
MLPTFPPPPETAALRAAILAHHHALAPNALTPEPTHEPAHELDALQAAYRGIRTQSARGRDAVQLLSGAYPELPIWTLPRREPPPNSLVELEALGEQFTLVESAR